MVPNIRILQLVQGAKEATGLTVVIDVCRAFSTAAVLISRGAEEILPVSTLEEAFELKRRMPNCLLVGEVGGRKPDGFDIGNSPSEVLSGSGEGKVVKGKVVVQRTSAGTQGIVNARHAGEILTGSFVNAGAIVRYIRKAQPETVSLVCMGWEAKSECEEDTLLAKYLEAMLLGREISFSEIVAKIQGSDTGSKFRDAAYPWLPEEDLNHCLSLDLFDFVLRCEPAGEIAGAGSIMPVGRLRRIDV